MNTCQNTSPVRFAGLDPGNSESCCIVTTWSQEAGVLMFEQISSRSATDAIATCMTAVRSAMTESDLRRSRQATYFWRKLRRTRNGMTLRQFLDSLPGGRCRNDGKKLIIRRGSTENGKGI